MAAWAGKFDFLLNAIPAGHEVNPYVNLLKFDRTMCIVGAIEPLGELNAAAIVFARKALAGSLIGGIQETQEMLDFCGQHNIVADVEIIRMDEINEAFVRMQKRDVKYRFVIGMNSLSAQ